MLSRRILLIFIDGLGVGESNPERNPLAQYPDLWPTLTHSPSWPGLQWKSLDACLGVAGLPQSATGQTALLTGVNAPQLLGKHLQGFPSKQLVEVLKERSIFVRLQQGGWRGTFANAYRHPEDITTDSRLSVTSHALKASGQPFRSLEDLRRQNALTHDFTNTLLIEKGYEVPLFSPDQAAKILVNLAEHHHFTLYEHFLTDVLAHRGTADAINRHLLVVNQFLRSVLEETNREGIFLMLTSDHGNIEENTTRTHTRNPVPLMWLDDGKETSTSPPDDITGVTPWILSLLSCSDHRRASGQSVL